VLGRQPQRRAARGQDEQPRRGGEQVGDEWSRREQLLEIVEDEQDPALSQVLADALGEGSASFAYLECVGDRGHEQLRARDRSQADEERAVP